MWCLVVAIFNDVVVVGLWFVCLCSVLLWSVVFWFALFVMRVMVFTLGFGV